MSTIPWIDAMTSNRSVRRPRVRTNSERDRRRQNGRTNYARNRNTFKTKSRVWNEEEHKLDVGCKRRTQRQQDLQGFHARRIELETNRRKAFLSDLLRRRTKYQPFQLTGRSLEDCTVIHMYVPFVVFLFFIAYYFVLYLRSVGLNLLFLAYLVIFNLVLAFCRI